MNYDESIAYIESLMPGSMVPSLERFAAFMRAHGNPQDTVGSIHVAGTNGKGSTVAMIEAILRSFGLKTGRFTGPHILRWNERLHVAGKPVSDLRFAALATRMRQLSQEFGAANADLGELSWFEFLTAMAFFLFAEEAVDCAVVEVGLGGRFDATNVLSRPRVAAISSIGLDHTHILGNSLEKIAFEKSGIIKPASPVVSAAHGVALEMISSCATAAGAPLILCSDPALAGLKTTGDSRPAVRRHLPAPGNTGSATCPTSGVDATTGSPAELAAITAKGSCRAQRVLYVSGRILAWCADSGSPAEEDGSVRPFTDWQRFEDIMGRVKVALEAPGNAVSHLAPFQRGNLVLAATCVAAAAAQEPGWSDPTAHLDSAIGSIFWPGRMQYFEGRQLLIDAAHNPDGAIALREALDQLFSNSTRTYVLSFYQNKNVEEFMDVLLRPGDTVISGEAAGRRPVVSSGEITSLARARGCTAIQCQSIDDACRISLKRRREGHLIATGSFATVKAMMLALGFRTVEDSQKELY